MWPNPRETAFLCCVLLIKRYSLAIDYFGVIVFENFRTLSGPILESMGTHAIFQKKGKKRGNI